MKDEAQDSDEGDLMLSALFATARALGTDREALETPPALAPVPPPASLTAGQWLLRELAPYGAGLIKQLGVAVALVMVALAVARCIGTAP